MFLEPVAMWLVGSVLPDTGQAECCILGRFLCKFFFFQWRLL